MKVTIRDFLWLVVAIATFFAGFQYSRTRELARIRECGLRYSVALGTYYEGPDTGNLFPVLDSEAELFGLLDIPHDRERRTRELRTILSNFKNGSRPNHGQSPEA